MSLANIPLLPESPDDYECRWDLTRLKNSYEYRISTKLRKRVHELMKENLLFLPSNVIEIIETEFPYLEKEKIIAYIDNQKYRSLNQMNKLLKSIYNDALVYQKYTNVDPFTYFKHVVWEFCKNETTIKYCYNYLSQHK